MASNDPLPASLLAPETHFGRYQIVRPIGEGGMGVVYEALHTELNKRVAVKVLRPAAARLPDWRTRFLREGQTAASIHHPNVAEVFDVGEQDGLLYLVMEFLEGETLSALLRRHPVLPVKRAVDLLLPVCAALSVAHEQSIVHRDLKPDNIFLATSRHGGLQPKLLDFGISKTPTSEPRITTADALLGTPHYMSPEQASGLDVDARGDQYALGVLLYECTTGHRPYEGGQLYPLLQAIVHGDAPRPRTLCPDLSEAFEAIVVQSMARDPAARFPDMDALGRALLPFASRTAQGLWHPIFRNAGTPELPLSTVPAAPIYALPTLPDARVDHAVRESLLALLRDKRHARRIPLIAGSVALAFALAGATLVAVARPPRPTAAPAHAHVVPALPRASLAPRASALGNPAALRPTGFAPALPAGLVLRSLVPPPETADAGGTDPRAPNGQHSHPRSHLPAGVTRGTNRAPIMD